MKKAIVLAVLIALLCVIFHGCTPTSSNNGQSEADVNMPTINPNAGDDEKTPVGSEAASQESNQELPQVESVENPDTNLQTPDTTAPESTSVSDGSDAALEPEVDPEDGESDLEIVTEYVVDGGNGFGIGGN